MRSFIRWAGSKQQLLPTLRRHWLGGNRRYIEPFCGSACLYFELEPEEAVLGDINSDLIRALRAVQCDVQLVLECFRRLPTGKKAYYRVRATDPDSLTENEAAARFLYLNLYCFNGLYRTNLKGRFNVPYGRTRDGKSIDEDRLLKASQVLQTATLVNSDFEKTISWARPGDFVYLDPPYVVRKRRVFSEYGPGSLSHDDLDRLASCLRRLDRKGVFFLITYAESNEARRLLAPWKLSRVSARRNIAGFTGARRRAYELLASNI